MNWLSKITQSEYFYIIGFIILYLVYGIRMYLISRKVRISIGRLLMKFILRSAYFSLFIIALLGPSFGDIKKEIKAIGKDIYIAVDVSTSMNAQDISPSRLEKVKFEIGTALKNFNSDRIGLIIFSDEAFVQCPLTYDHSAIRLFLQSINTKSISTGGTNINAPLALAYHKLTENKDGKSADQAKILWLITDGEDFSEQNPDGWIGLIKKAGINLFVLGVGSEEGAKIPGDQGWKKNNAGLYVESALNPKSLKEIASSAQGRYYEITPETNEVKTLINKIVKVEGTLKGSRKIESAANKYFYFLFVGIVLVLLDVIISVKTIRV